MKVRYSELYKMGSYFDVDDVDNATVHQLHLHFIVRHERHYETTRMEEMLEECWYFFAQEFSAREEFTLGNSLHPKRSYE